VFPIPFFRVTADKARITSFHSLDLVAAGVGMDKDSPSHQEFFGDRSVRCNGLWS
jgi:hypothetical protein